MRPHFISPLQLITLSVISGITASQAANQYWNPSPLTDNWANSVWSASSGGGSLTTWTAANDAFFDQAGSYGVTINAAQTATNLNIAAGTVTFSGTNTVSSTAITIDSGATLSGVGERYLKVGTTTLTVNGTLDYTALTDTARRVSIAGGTGSIILGAGMRIGGAVTFAGNISGAGALVTDAGGIITLSGNNTYSGDTLIRSSNTLRLGSATALSANSSLRIGGGVIIELTGTNFSRNVTATIGAGNVRFNNAGDGTGTSGFAAVNADRTVALNGTVQWGSTAFNPTIFNLGTSASTHKVTLTTGIDLNAATRTINTANGSAAVEAEISGSLTGTGASLLTKTGTGVLLLSNANSHAGGTTIAQSQGAINPLRISNASALGSGSLTIGGGGANDQARLELTGGISVTNNISGPTVRSLSNKNAHVLNVSGTNTLTKNITTTTGGERFNLQSDGGNLRLTGNLSTRRLLLAGDGDGEIVGTTTIAATYGIEKEGSGTWILNSGSLNNTSATVGSGTLLVNGTLTGSSAVVNGGTLGGTGSISGAVTLNSTGVLAPGASIGTLATGDLTFNTGSSYLYQINTTGAGTADRLDANGNLDFNGTITLNLADLGAGNALVLGTKFTMISYSGSWTSGEIFNGYADDLAFTMFGNQWRINYNDTSTGSANGGAFLNAVTLTVIPEPDAAMMVGGFGLLALVRRRR